MKDETVSVKFNTKLSRKHLSQLREIASTKGAGVYAFVDDAAFAKLAGLGLVTWRPNRKTASQLGRFDITEAGFAAISKAEARS